MSARALAIALLAGTAAIWGTGIQAAGSAKRHAYSTPVVESTGVQTQVTMQQAAPATDRAASYTQSAPSGTTTAQVLPDQVRPQATPSSSGPDYSIYDAHVDLLRDDDGDGFYHRFELNFDADTSYYSADVYARLYLSYQGGPYYHYYTTDTFTIDGSASDDDYEVSTTLTSGYPSGYYDLAIDLYEAGSHHLVASIDGYADYDLSALPLEDLGHEETSTPGVSLFTGVLLIADDDHDGYYHRFAVDIDVDMPHDSRLVYATIDVRTPHGEWLHEHTTTDFLVDDVGPHDIVRVNGDWESGYPPGRYDFRIGIYDAHTHELIAENGPTMLTLLGVPLEDALSDHYVHPAPAPLPAPGHHGHTVSHGHGGSSATGLWVVLMLGLAFLGKFRWGQIERPLTLALSRKERKNNAVG